MKKKALKHFSRKKNHHCKKKKNTKKHFCFLKTLSMRTAVEFINECYAGKDICRALLLGQILMDTVATYHVTQGYISI